jgi:hypothetical protein
MDLIQALNLDAKKATGSISITAIADGDQVTIDDGIITAKSFEFDNEADKAAGTIALSNIPADGDSITISDGVTPKIFEFDRGLNATGVITVNTIPADGTTVTIKDSTQAATVFEWDNGVLATGTITLAANAADTNIVTLNDGANAAVVFEFDIGTKAAGSLSIGTDPLGGTTLTISDGVHTPTIFEFVTAGEAAVGHTAVACGTSKEDTMAALVAAINGITTTLTVTATAAGTPDHTCTLMNDNYTDVGNVAITTTAADITIVGMVNGALAGNGAITATRYPVAIGATKEATIVNLIAAINSCPATLSVAATPSVPADAVCNLTCEIRNANGAISKTGSDITVAGMTNGKAPGAGPVTGTNVAVAVGATVTACADNLHAAINAVVAGLLVTSAKTTPASGTLNLTADAVGSAENITITQTGSHCTLIGMRDGADPGSGAVTLGRIPVAAHTSATVTMAALVVAINSVGAAMALTATAATPADHTCTLETDVGGTAGNVVITKVGATITVTGMAGGTDVGDNVQEGATALAISGDGEGLNVPIMVRNLCEAINRSGLCIQAAPEMYDSPKIILTHTKTGTIGNETVTKTGDGITVTGMAGGIAQLDPRPHFEVTG